MSIGYPPGSKHPPYCGEQPVKWTVEANTVTSYVYICVYWVYTVLRDKFPAPHPEGSKPGLPNRWFTIIGVYTKACGKCTCLSGVFISKHKGSVKNEKLQTFSSHMQENVEVRKSSTHRKPECVSNPGEQLASTAVPPT